MSRIGDLVKELSEDGNVKKTSRRIPVKLILRRWRMLFGPQNPGGKDAVKKGLDKGGTKEMLTLSPFEF
jgi:hypothetical protein